MRVCGYMFKSGGKSMSSVGRTIQVDSTGKLRRWGIIQKVQKIPVNYIRGTTPLVNHRQTRSLSSSECFKVFLLLPVTHISKNNQGRDPEGRPLKWLE